MRTIVLWTMKDEIGARIFSDYLSIYKISMKLFAFALTLFLIAPGEGVAEPGSNEIYAKFIVNSDGIWFRKCHTAGSAENSADDICKKLGQVHRGDTVYVGYQLEDLDSISGKWSGVYMKHLPKKEADIDKYGRSFGEKEDKRWVYIKSQFLAPLEGEIENYWERYKLKSETNRAAFVRFLSIFPNAGRDKMTYAYRVGCSSNKSIEGDFDNLVCATTKSFLGELKKDRKSVV